MDNRPDDDTIKQGREDGSPGVLLFYRGWSGKASLINWPLNCSLKAIRAFIL